MKCCVRHVAPGKIGVNVSHVGIFVKAKGFVIKDGRIGTARVREVMPLRAGGTAGHPGVSAGTRGGKRQRRTAEVRKGATPQELLTEAAIALWGDAAVPEFEDGVPGRGFRIDLAFPAVRLAVEVDGWQFHGRMLGDFERDREG
jgi:hypothetical protein